MDITLNKYLQTFVRPLIGDVKQYDANNVLVNNMLKYEDTYLQTLYNEALRDVAKHTDFLNKEAHFLISVGQRELNLPDDFAGHHSRISGNINISGTDDTRYMNDTIVKLNIQGKRLVFDEPITSQMVQQWKKSLLSGVVISQDIINYLVQSGQLVLSGTGVLYAEQLEDKMIISLRYKYTAEWHTDLNANVVTDEDLLLTLKYYIGAKALESDQPNEATNKAKEHFNFYIYMRDNLDKSNHRWEDISLSTYRGDI